MAFNAATLKVLNETARARLGIPGMFAISKTGNLYLTPNYMASVGYRSKLNLLGLMVEVSQKAASDTAGYTLLIAESLKIEQKQGGSEHLLQAHRTLAQGMREAVLKSYGQQIEARKQVPSYARTNRLSGALRTALRARDRVVASEEGIEYVNQDRLNLEARHWQRLNFGVRGAPGARRGAATSKAPQQFKLRANNQSLGKTVGFRAKPRPPMYLPAGFWQFVGGRTNFDEKHERRQYEEDRSEKLERLRQEKRAARGRSTPEDTSSRTGATTASYYFSQRDRPGSQTPRYGRLRMPSQTYQSYTRGRRRSQSSIVETGGFFGRSLQREAGRTSEQRDKRTVTRRGRLSVRYSQQGFWPTSQKARYPTRGIQATNFLDAGFKHMAENIDKVYLQYAAAVQNDATKTAESKALNRSVLRYRPGLNFSDHWPINRERIIPNTRPGS
jgi:hypothetical protein